MKDAETFETLVHVYQTTRCRIPDYSNIHLYWLEVCKRVIRRSNPAEKKLSFSQRFWSLGHNALNAASFAATSVSVYQSTRRHIPEDHEPSNVKWTFSLLIDKKVVPVYVVTAYDGLEV